MPSYQGAVLKNPYEHFAFFGGFGVGKSFTGAHWAVQRMIERPDLTGLIGANTYDQLSQATLRELFLWLDTYGIEYVIDQRPPRDWGIARKAFKSYKNILSLKIDPKVITTVFTRVMSKPNPLRGVNCSWYWMDEARDTPRNTFEVILSRLREDNHYRRGLLTTTTNGEDWAFENFVAKASKTRGSCHVPSQASVDAGINSPEWLKAMQELFDPLTAEQELNAGHVDVLSGRAYHSFGKHNAKACPWGDAAPNPARPLIVGMDFNYDPAPMVWVVGQLGPTGSQWENAIHWFGEIAKRQTSTREQTRVLVDIYGKAFFYQCYGDASGTRGSTSNQGEHDYAQMADELDGLEVGFTIDVDQSNPRVVDRVTNMNRLARNAAGEVSMTYDKQACPHLHTDVRKVAWRKTLVGKAKLDDKGDHKLTHASDAAGYAVWKVLPLARRGILVPSVSGSEALRNVRAIG